MKMGWGQKIKDFRLRLDENQEGFGSRYGVKASAVSAWEREEKTPPLSTLVQMAQDMGISLDSFIADKPTGRDAQGQSPSLTEREELVLALYRRAPPEIQELMFNRLVKNTLQEPPNGL